MHDLIFYVELILGSGIMLTNIDIKDLKNILRKNNAVQDGLY